MQADRPTDLAWRLPVALAVVAALMAGGCSAAKLQSPVWRPPTAEAAMTPRVVPSGAAPFDEAVSLVSELKYPEAEIQFRRSLVWFQAAGEMDRSAECMFWIGFCQEKQGRAAEARAQYEKTTREYPGTPAASMAAQRMGRLPAAPTSAPPRGELRT